MSNSKNKTICSIPPKPDDLCCPGTNGSYTTADLMNAMAFATAQVNKLKAEDPDIIKKYCQGTSKCFQWKNHQSNQLWPNTNFKPQDIKSKDPSKQFPWEKWTDWTTSGHIHIVDEATCKAAGQVPYKCDSKSCTWLDNKQIKAPYSEWQTSMCYNVNEKIVGKTVEGVVSCKSVGECMKDENCSGTNTCVNGKCTCSDNNECNGTSSCNNGVCETNAAGCFLGNFLLKEWCENPQSRCALENGSYPKECQGSSTEIGVTDVPPFVYNEKNGSCFMSPDYCNRFGVDSVNSKPCSSDTDCDTGATCIDQPILGKKMCVGPTTECAKGSLWEMMVGKTLFRMWKSGVKCPDLEGYEFNKTIIDKLNNLPEKLEKLIDPKFIETKLLLQKEFIPGIDIYMIKWNKLSNKEVLYEVGFDIEQINNKYPTLLVIKNNKQYLVITKNQVKNDPSLKKIYGILGLNKDLTQIFATFAFGKNVKK